MSKKSLLSYCVAAMGLIVFQSARAEVLSLGVEPIVGYERTQKLLPNPHTTDRLIYGARLTVGIPLVAAEAQVTRGTDMEEFPEQNLSIRDTDDKVKLGLRSSLRLSSLLSFQARGGGQAKRNTHEETRNGELTKTVSPIVYKPYAGLGLGARLARNVELSGNVTAVFNDFPRMAANEYETTLGFKVRLP